MEHATVSATPSLRMARRRKVRASTVAVVASAVVGSLVALAAVAQLAGVVSLGGLPASRGLDLLAIAFLVGAGPAILVTERRIRRRRLIDARLPDFLSDLASLHKAGLTLHQAVITASSGDYGPLSPEVRRTADQARWNIPVLTALENLRRRLDTPLSERALTVVLEAGRSGGNVPEVLELAAQNTRSTVALREQRARAMGVYTIITYVASLVFIGVALAMQLVFVPRMLDAFSTTAGSALQLGSNLPTAEAFRGLFYTAALVQAFGNGLVGGLIGEGSARAGFKHAWAMVAMAFAGFLLSP